MVASEALADKEANMAYFLYMLTFVCSWTGFALSVILLVDEILKRRKKK